MRSIIFTFALVAAILTLTPYSFAEIVPHSLTVSPFIGGYTFDGTEHIETSPLFGIRGGYIFTKNIGAELFFDFATTDFSGHSPLKSNDVNLYRYGVDILYHFLPDSRFVPYVAAGYGGRTIDPDGKSSDTRGIFDYGIGAKYAISDRIGIRGDLRHLLLRDNHTIYNYEYTVGISFNFGSAPSSVPGEAPVLPTPQKKLQPLAPAPAPKEEPPLEPVPPTEPTPEKMKYCVAMNIRFEIDRTEVQPQYDNEVGKVGDFMRKYPATTAVIEGHADEVGSDEYNMDLSRRRAESVITYLVERFGIDRAHLTATWYGKTRPIADNSTNEGRQKNRRINAIIDCAVDIKQIAPPPQKLCMTLKVEFDPGSAEIKPQYHDAIANVAEYMKKYPTTTALIEGHTDNVGEDEENLRLSQQRAESVVKYLQNKLGIEAGRLAAKGYGATRRIAYNGTPEGRQRNRRINAIIDCVTK